MPATRWRARWRTAPSNTASTRAIDPVLREFLYLPFMHSEHLPDQLRCIELSRDGRPCREPRNGPSTMPTSSGGSGAFPHRNRLLGRATTPEEQAFLDEAAFRPDDGSVNGRDRCRFRPLNIVPAEPPRSKKHPLIEGELTMTIQVGDKLPEAKFRVMTAEGPQVKTTDDIFKGKKVALFAVPGAYTGTCHKMHLPSIFLNAYAIKDKGVNTIAIVSVNDAFVMNAWKRDTDQRDEAIFLADGNADFTKAIGMELDASGNGLGIRSKRYSMLVEDGVVKKLNLEPAPGKVEVSGGDTLLGQL